MSAVAQKLSESLKKWTWFPVFSLERKMTFWAGSQFYVGMWPALRKGSGWSYSQRIWSTIGTRGGKKNYDNCDYDDDDVDYDDDNDDDDDFNVFFIPKSLKQGWHQGEPIYYDGYDKIDDNDDNDDDEDDDDDDNNDGNGVFFLTFFCKNLIFEALL